jgi:hypothetical protein
MNAIIQHSKNLVLYYGFNSGIILMKASNTNDVFWIDFEDFQCVKNYRWHVNSVGYMEAKINYQHVLLHRFVKNARDGICIDHIHGNILDNRKHLLREATHSQNSKNRKISSNNKSGFKGVSYRADKNQWRANICFTDAEGRNNKLEKSFATALEAARQYDIWGREFHAQIGASSQTCSSSASPHLTLEAPIARCLSPLITPLRPQ